MKLFLQLSFVACIANVKKNTFNLKEKWFHLFRIPVIERSVQVLYLMDEGNPVNPLKMEIKLNQTLPNLEKLMSRRSQVCFKRCDICQRYSSKGRNKASIVEAFLY